MKLTISQEGSNPITIKTASEKTVRSNEGLIDTVKQHEQKNEETRQRQIKFLNYVNDFVCNCDEEIGVIWHKETALNGDLSCFKNCFDDDDDIYDEDDYISKYKYIEQFNLTSNISYYNDLKQAKDSVLTKYNNEFANMRNSGWHYDYFLNVKDDELRNLAQKIQQTADVFETECNFIEKHYNKWKDENLIADLEQKREAYLKGNPSPQEIKDKHEQEKTQQLQQRVGDGLAAGVVGAAAIGAYLLAGTIYDKVTSIGYFNSGNDMLSSPKLLSNIERAKSKFSRPATAAEVKSSPIAKSKTTFLSKILGRGGSAFTDMNVINKIGTMGLLVKDVNGVAVSVATLNGSEKASKSNKVIIATAYGYNSQGKFISVPLARGFLNAGNVVNASRESVNAITVSHNGKVIYKTK